MTPWVNQGSWNTSSHCKVEGVAHVTVPFPHNWTSASDGGRSPVDQNNNNAMGLLLPDNRTLIQMQPVYRCSPGAPLLARWGPERGCTQSFPNVTDILGDGALGAHGGSGLSSIGGTIRMGELLPDRGAIRHALKLELYGHDYYFGGHPLNPPSKRNQGNTQYHWPATGCDGDWNGTVSGLRYSGIVPALAPGSLLAIPPEQAATVRTTTTVGSKIRQALIDYGGYLVDDTAGNSAAICMEAGVNEEMRKTYNFTMTFPAGVAAGPLYDDLLVIFKALYVVENNGRSSVGGGGDPRVPLAPPICGAPA